MQITALFRTILVACILSEIIQVVAAITLADTMPIVLQEYVMHIEDIVNFDNSNISLLIALILFFVPIIGLWKFKNWARIIYFILIIANIYPCYDPIVMNPWETTFNQISLTLDGILIAMMFFSPIRQKFNK